MFASNKIVIIILDSRIENGETMKAALYTRKSTSSSQRQLNSHRVQKECVENFCSSHGYELVEEFSDSLSGTTNNRPGFQSAIEWLKSDPKNTLVVYRVDRIARNLSVWAELEPVMGQLRVVELGNEPVNLMVLSVLLSVAAQESKNISSRVRAAYKSIKAQNPSHVWGNRDALLKVRTKGEAVRKANADKYAQKLYEMDAMLQRSGVSTLRERVEFLNSQGFTSRRGKPLTVQGLHRTLKRYAA